MITISDNYNRKMKKSNCVQRERTDTLDMIQFRNYGFTYVYVALLNSGTCFYAKGNNETIPKVVSEYEFYENMKEVLDWEIG